MTVVSYKIFPKKRLIVEYLSGSLGWLDIVEMKKKEVAEPDYNPSYNVITDIRNVSISIETLDDVNIYINYLQNNRNSVGKRHTAIITDSTEQVVHSELLRATNNSLPIYLKTVGTYQAAFEWVSLKSPSSIEIKDFIEFLRRKDPNNKKLKKQRVFELV